MISRRQLFQLLIATPLAKLLPTRKDPVPFFEPRYYEVSVPEHIEDIVYFKPMIGGSYTKSATFDITRRTILMARSDADRMRLELEQDAQKRLDAEVVRGASLPPVDTAVYDDYDDWED